MSGFCIAASHSPQTITRVYLETGLELIPSNLVPTSSNPSLQHYDHDEFIQICRCYLRAHWIIHPLSFLGGCSRSVHAPLLPRLVLCKHKFQPVGTCLPYIHSRLLFIQTFVPVASTIKRR